MEITNEERREVAENLRSMVDYSCRYSEQFYELLTETVMDDWDFHSFPDTAERLADLIDRPTCRIIKGAEKPKHPWGTCSRCGVLVDSRNAISNATRFLPTRFCPNCGAEVRK